MDFFYLLLQASFISVFAIIFVLLLRAVLKDKLDRRVFILLWAVIIFRLLVVDSVTSPVSFAKLLPEFPVISDARVLVHGDTPAFDRSSLNTGTAESDRNIAATAPQVYSAATESSNIPWLFSIWLIGVTAMITGTFMLYLLFQFKSRNIIKLKDIGYEKEIGDTEVFLSDQVTSPVTIGIINPQIHLPDSIDFRDKESLRHILLHEMTHIKRYDNLLKLVMMLALSLHWFNPLVWVLCRTLNKDIECSCDEATVSKLGETSKADYANTLLKMAETGREANVAGLVFVSFESSFLKERVVNIMRKRYPAALSAMAAAVFSVCMFAVFATNAQATAGYDEFGGTTTVLVLKAKEEAKPEKEEIVTKQEVFVAKQSVPDGSKEKPPDPKTVGSSWLAEHKTFQGADINHPVTKNRLLTVDEVKIIALKTVGGGQIVKIEFESDKKKSEYDIEIIKDNAEYDIEIDAHTGEILEYEKKDIPIGKKVAWTQKMITVQKASEIALKAVGGNAEIIKSVLDSKKGHDAPFYLIDVKNDDGRQRVQINALTGEIMK